MEMDLFEEMQPEGNDCLVPLVCAIYRCCQIIRWKMKLENELPRVDDNPIKRPECQSGKIRRPK